MSNLGPSFDKIWDLLGGPRTPLVPFLVALMVNIENNLERTYSTPLKLPRG